MKNGKYSTGARLNLSNRQAQITLRTSGAAIAVADWRWTVPANSPTFWHPAFQSKRIAPMAIPRWKFS
jgi:hypothetical protein